MVNHSSVAERGLRGAMFVPAPERCEIGIVSIFIWLRGKIDGFVDAILVFVHGIPDLMYVC